MQEPETYRIVGPHSQCVGVYPASCFLPHPAQLPPWAGWNVQMSLFETIIPQVFSPAAPHAYRVQGITGVLHNLHILSFSSLRSFFLSHILIGFVIHSRQQRVGISLNRTPSGTGFGCMVSLPSASVFLCMSHL